MVFVLDNWESVNRPHKRRRVIHPTDMARRWWQEEELHELPKSDHDTPPEEATAAEQQESLPEKEIVTSDREELIQCIKRGQKPTWVPKPGLEALCTEANAQAIVKPVTESTNVEHHSNGLQQGFKSGENIKSFELRGQSLEKDPIERPPSALHAGDFRDRSSGNSGLTKLSVHTAEPFHDLFDDPRYESSRAWFDRSPQQSLSRSTPKPGDWENVISEASRRTRAPSLGSSLSSTFVMRVPTSPLVYAMNNTSLDFSPQESIVEPYTTTSRGIRRRTMPPNAFQGLKGSPTDTGTPNFSRPLPQPYLRSEGSLPYQTHTARRSLSSVTYQPASNPRPSFPPRSRRPSFASDVSPRQHAAMVGSFEESILRGRMSTGPSKPLDFVAQIGVLGKGNCPASLKCPAHVSVPFPAVFYSYSSTAGSRSVSDDSPSPYVGTIDLEHNLKPVEPPAKRRRQSSIDVDADPDAFIAQITGPENTSIGRALAKESREKKRTTAKTPLGGAYRVPQQGQLQIVIKNPNKTAVKLYLVPYDLDGMQPGTKTFVRQRSFSSGPILETALSDNPANTTLHDPLMDKHILRYLIHLKFCSPAKGRFYLYDNIRVVFANRVPDGRGKLRIEVQLPEPRFSPYKPTNSRRSSVSDILAFHKMSDVNLSPPMPMEGILASRSRELKDLAFRSPPIPFALTPNSVADRDPDDQQTIASRERRAEDVVGVPMPENMQGDAASQGGPQSPVAGFHLVSTSTRSSPVPWHPDQGSVSTRSFSPAPPETGNGLLSQQIRELNGLYARNGSLNKDMEG